MIRRVLFMINSMAGGGSERQTVLLLRHLDRQQFLPELFLTHRQGPLLGEIPDDVVVHAYDDQPAGSGWYYPGRELKRQVAFLTDILRHRSIEAIYDRTFHMTLLAGPAGRAAGIGRVSTIVSPPHVALPMVEKKFVGLKRRRLAKAYRMSGQVVAVSQQAGVSACEYYGLASEAVRVVPNPIDLQEIREKSQADNHVRERFGNERINVVVVSRMSAEKGHHDLLSALELTESQWPANCPRLEVWLIGDGVLRQELEQRVATWGCSHRVNFIGILPNPAPWIAAADVLILPSHFEGMPNVVLEAMALETDVLATKSGGTVELQASEPTMLLAEPQDSGSLASAIIQWVRDRKSAQQRRKAAVKYVRACHDVRTTIHEIEGMLRTV